MGRLFWEGAGIRVSVCVSIMKSRRSAAPGGRGGIGVDGFAANHGLAPHGYQKPPLRGYRKSASRQGCVEPRLDRYGRLYELTQLHAGFFEQGGRNGAQRVIAAVDHFHDSRVDD